METELLVARLSTRGQLALPKPVRDQLDLTEGVRLSVRVRGDEIVLRKLDSEAWKRWSGRFKGSPLLHDLARERRRELAHDRRA
jgi:AbrB family looped-hinge helix DNA binding protein